MSNLPIEKTSVKANSLLFRHQFDLTEIEPKTKTTLSQMIHFCGEKSFRLILKNRDSVPHLFLLATNLNKMGNKVVDAHLFCDNNGQPFFVDDGGMELKTSSQDGTGSFQMFETVINGIVSGDVSFDCHIYIKSIVEVYKIQLIDYHLSNQLWSTVVNQDSTDFNLITRGKTFPVHKFVLAARSPVFSALFDNGTLQLKLPFVNAACLEQFLKFIYTGELEGPVISDQLMKLAKTYKITTLIELCRAASHDIPLGELATMASGLQWTKKPSVQIKLEPEPDIDYLSNALVLKCTWNVEWTKKRLSQDYSEMSATFIYQDKDFFRAKIRVRQEKPLKTPELYDSEDEDFRDFKMTFLSYHHQRIGSRVSGVFYTTKSEKGYNSRPRDMNENPAVDSTLFQTFYCSDSFEVPCRIFFYVKLSSMVSNFGHKFVDSTWKEQLWASAVNKQFTDLEFLVGDESISAHRSLLSARSPVFAAMFTSGMEEAITGQVRIEDADFSTFCDFLKFLYTGTLESSVKKEELLAVADKYQVETLLNVCKLATKSDISDVTEAFFGW